jgi:TatD DNase family protein
MLADAHIHFVDLAARDPGSFDRWAAQPRLACSASHDLAEFQASEALRARAAFDASFGIHPQWPVWNNADLLADLAAGGRIAAIGEAGFDFYGDVPARVRTAENEAQQTAVFEYQLGIAERTGLPMVLHIRKAMDRLFAYSARLARLPAVILHSFSGTAREGTDLLARGVVAYFSFGAAILNGHKRAIEACALLPAGSLLSETDAPWQPPKGRSYCPFEALSEVLGGMARIRRIEERELEAQLEENYRRAYGRKG